jgi:DNA-binding response OmpR family regulator
MPYDEKEVSRKDRAPVKCILVVEDDAANGACIAQMIVQETPYHVLLAPTSLRALEIVGHIRPHLFIFDYRLPQMNGLQLFDQLHALAGLEEVPALILTACWEDCKAEIEARKLIAMRKPFDMDEFLLTIGEILGRPSDLTDSSSRQPVLVP